MFNKIKYLVKTEDSYPCFMWPVIEKQDGLYLPLSNNEQRITSFRKIETGDFALVIPILESNIRINEGSETIFAYAFDEHTYFYDTFDIFSAKIKNYLDSHSMANNKDVFKQYALYSKIQENEKTRELLESILKKRTDLFLINWAMSKMREHGYTEDEITSIKKIADDEISVFETQILKICKFLGVSIREHIDTARIICENDLGIRLDERMYV